MLLAPQEHGGTVGGQDALASCWHQERIRNAQSLFLGERQVLLSTQGKASVFKQWQGLKWPHREG